MKGHLPRTPTLPAEGLSRATGARVFVKYETMHAIGAFKERGAFTRLAALSESERRRGVVAMSAGNHAQAVARHASLMGTPAVIVMPEATPTVKVDNTRGFGARIVLKGQTLAESQKEALRIAADERRTLVHPYDDPLIMAGQGTVGLEMLADCPDLDAIVVPIGGGGLISGIAVAAKTLKPGIEIVGVQTQLYPSFVNALRGEKRPVGGATLAEGIAVKTVGRLTLPVVRALVDDILLVDEVAIEEAVNLYATEARVLAEGAGAAGLAALLRHRERFARRRVGLVLCGGNIDARILASVMVRALERADRILSFRVTGQDRPGLLGRIAMVLGQNGANILEVQHGRLFLDVPAKGVSIDFTVEARGREHAKTVLAALKKNGLNPQRLDPRGLGETAY
jgi:threonine dehydratase